MNSRFANVAVVAASAALAGAIALALGVAMRGPIAVAMPPPFGWHLVYVDALTAVLLPLVASIGLAVVAYTRNYLDGDARQAYFTRLICAALPAVLALMLSGNVLVLLLAWVATNLAAQYLLEFYRERPYARLAAAKKFAVSRLSELCILAAAILLYRAFGTLDVRDLIAAAKALHGTAPAPGVQVAALLLVAAAMLACAQFPTHGWLLEVMETPTPVSALLHAGIVNAGGFLILRFADLVSLSVPSLATLAIVGGVSALFGSVVMLTQTSVKVSLAYSTVAQMGFMLFECGVGAYPAAVLHLVAHSFYKAHAFLSSGSVIDVFRSSYVPPRQTSVPRLLPAVAIAFALALAFAISRLRGWPAAYDAGAIALLATALLGIVHFIYAGLAAGSAGRVVLPTSLAAGTIAVAYLGLQAVSERVFHGTLPLAPPQNVSGVVATVAVVLAFAVVLYLQEAAPWQRGTGLWEPIYAHVANGFYVNTAINRVLLRVRAVRR